MKGNKTITTEDVQKHQALVEIAGESISDDGLNLLLRVPLRNQILDKPEAYMLRMIMEQEGMVYLIYRKETNKYAKEE